LFFQYFLTSIEVFGKLNAHNKYPPILKAVIAFHCCEVNPGDQMTLKSPL